MLKNGNLKVALEIVIVVFQTILVIFGMEIRSIAKDHEARIDTLEQFKAKGDRWTMTQQLEHEKDISERLSELANDHHKIKARLGVD